MSEVIVASTAACTGVLAAALLAAAGVAVGAACRLASTIIDRDFDVERMLGAPAIGEAFTRSMQAARARLEAEYVSTCSLQAVRAGQQPAAREAAKALAHAEAMRAALRQQPVLALVAEAHRGAALRTALADLERAHHTLRTGAVNEAAHAARVAREELQATSQEALDRLALGHRTVVAEAFRRAFADLGYRVQEAGGESAVALRGMRGSQALGVVVLDGGKTIVDAAGFDGLGCREATEELFGRVREQGVSIQVDVRAPHRRREGGVLLTGSKATAEGLLDATERLRSTGRGSESAPGRTSEARRRQAAGAVAHLRRQQRTSG